MDLLLSSFTNNDIAKFRCKEVNCGAKKDRDSVYHGEFQPLEKSVFPPVLFSSRISVITMSF